MVASTNGGAEYLGGGAEYLWAESEFPNHGNGKREPDSYHTSKPPTQITRISNNKKTKRSNQRNTNPDICHLQCRLFFFWSDAMAAAIAWGLNEKVKVSGIEIRSVRDRQ